MTRYSKITESVGEQGGPYHVATRNGLEFGVRISYS